jgi:hypothetical protein
MALSAMSLHRIGPICGLLFLPLYAAFTFVPELPQAHLSDEQVLDLYRDGSGTIQLGSLLMGLAGVAFLVFLADLHARLRPAGGTATLALAGGVTYVGMIFVAGTLWGSYAAGGSGGPFENRPDLDESATLARILSDTGSGVLLVYGLLAAAAMIAGAAAAGRSTGELPRGLVVAGWIIAPVLILGFAWLPQFLVPLWVCAAAAILLRRPASAEHIDPVPTRG